MCGKWREIAFAFSISQSPRLFTDSPFHSHGLKCHEISKVSLGDNHGFVPVSSRQGGVAETFFWLLCITTLKALFDDLDDQDLVKTWENSTDGCYRWIGIEFTPSQKHLKKERNSHHIQSHLLNLFFWFHVNFQTLNQGSKPNYIIENEHWLARKICWRIFTPIFQSFWSLPCQTLPLLGTPWFVGLKYRQPVGHAV